MQVSYACSVEDGDVDITAWMAGRKVGHVWSVRDGNRLKIADLLVRVDLHPAESAFLRSVRGLFGRRRNGGVRGRGIGRELMVRLLRAADAAGIVVVWGEIVAADLARWPGLVGWYERQGFVAGPTDADCSASAVRKVTRRR